MEALEGSRWLLQVDGETESVSPEVLQRHEKAPQGVSFPLKVVHDRNEPGTTLGEAVDYEIHHAVSCILDSLRQDLDAKGPREALLQAGASGLLMGAAAWRSVREGRERDAMIALATLQHQMRMVERLEGQGEAGHE